MAFRTDSQLLSLIKNKSNEEAKLFINKENMNNAVDASKNTLLHYAVEFGNSQIVQFLIELNSNVNVQNDLGQTPLIKSLKTDLPCQRVIELLLRADADIYVKDSAGESIFDMVNSSTWLREDTRRFEILKVFLEQAKYLDDFYDIPFDGNKEMIQSLLQTNVNICRADCNGKTLVHALASNGNPGVIEQLRGRNYDVDVRDTDGWTPLIYATTFGINNAVEFLLKEGADIDGTDYDQETALCFACYRYFNSDAHITIQLLLEHGANVQVKIDHDEIKTVFDLFPYDFQLTKLLLAHLVLQELLGTAITDLIRNKLNSDHRLTSFIEDCRQQLLNEICPSITLFNILTVSERKLERHLRDKQLASKLVDFRTSIDYFDTIVRKRLKMIELRKTAVQIICQLIKFDYDSYPFVVEEVAMYLEEQDIECLKLIENELP